MFSQEELKSVDSRYFNIITVDDYDVTIQSRNRGITGTCIAPAFLGMQRVSSSTSTNIAHPYHQHGRGNSLRQAIRSIQSHDRLQMNERNR